jgi:hypothetical protein
LAVEHSAFAAEKERLEPADEGSSEVGEQFPLIGPIAEDFGNLIDEVGERWESPPRALLV